MDTCNIKVALDGALLDEVAIECRPERVTIDESVDVHQIRRYLTNDAWLMVEDIVEQKKQGANWTCKATLMKNNR